MSNATLTKKQQIDNIFDAIEDLIPSNVLMGCPEWAEKNRYMNAKVTGRAGLFSFKNAPYTREIAACFSKTSPVQQVAIMKGVQLGLTTSVIENAIGYTIDADPSPMMFVFPTDADADNYKKLKIDNLIDNSDLRKKIVAETGNRNTRRTGDTSKLLEFNNGFMIFASCRKGQDLRRTNVKKLFLDELDAFVDNIPNEGSPIDIAVKRTDSYVEKGRKICYNSTPILAHKSKIYELVQKGDFRKFLVPCPHCHKKQELVFYKADGGLYPDKKATVKDGLKTKPFGIIFNIDECRAGDYKSVRYRCQHCGEDFYDYHKSAIEQDGEWVPTKQSTIPFFRSYHISTLYSLTKPWWNIVLDFIEAGNNPTKLQAFYNLDLGLPFEDRTGGVEYQTVHRLKDDMQQNNVIPKDALFLTAAADIQRNRIECEIKAWGDRYRCWGIDHRVFYGNTADIHDPCWAEFQKIRDEKFNVEGGGTKVVETILVDSGDGELRDVVYTFCDLDPERVFFPLKGFVSQTRTREKYKLVEVKEFDDLWLVEIYTDLYKNTLARYLSQPEPVNKDDYPDGWFTFAAGYGDEYFRQLTTERRVKTKRPDGLIKISWEQHGRNEAFDLNVYNLCAADLVIQRYSAYYLQLENPNAREVFKFLKSIKT